MPVHVRTVPAIESTPLSAQTPAPPEAIAPAEPATPFHRLGGRPVFVAIVERFYDLMEQEPAFAGLRAMHAADLAPMRKSLTGFLSGWAGGPRNWFEENPGRCMMSAHKPFAITPDLADQWARAMERAILETPSADAALARTMVGVLADIARGMARA